MQNQLVGQERKKYIGKKQIIRHLYEAGEMSGTMLAKWIGFSLPSANGYLNELIEEGILTIKGLGDSEGGRRPNIYSLVKDAIYILGIDISQRQFSISLFNSTLELVSDVSVRGIILGDDLSYLDILYSEAQKLIQECGIEEQRIIGLGVSLPGLINAEEGVSYTYLKSKGKSLQARLREKFNLPTYIENDSKSRALAELKHGGAKGTSNTIVLQLDWGVGTGMILNGALHNGKSGFSGEFSHIQIEENGRLCSCGKRGCLETLISGQSMVRKAHEWLAKEPKTSKVVET